VSTTSPTTPKPRRRWLQFSLRTLMVLVMVASVRLMWLGMKVREARKEREAAKAIEQLGRSSAPQAVGDASGLSASVDQTSSVRRLPGRVYTNVMRNPPGEGTRNEIVSIDPNSGDRRIEPIPDDPAIFLRISPSGTTAGYAREIRVIDYPDDKYLFVFMACSLEQPSKEVPLLPDPALGLALRADGKEMIRIPIFPASPYGLTWGPDGKQVIVTTCDYKVVNRTSVLRMQAWLANADGLGKTLLPVPDTHQVIDWSSDGKLLLTLVPPRTQRYEEVPGFPCVLYVMRTDGTDIRRVTPEGQEATGGRFSPDASSIAYVSVCRKAPETGPRLPVLPRRVNIVNFERGDHRVVVPENTAGCPVEVCWSPDGRFLAVMVDKWVEEPRGMSFTGGSSIDIYDLTGARICSLAPADVVSLGKELDWR
jgi:hypothetical protein